MVTKHFQYISHESLMKPLQLCRLEKYWTKRFHILTKDAELINNCAGHQKLLLKRLSSILDFAIQIS